MFFALFLLPGVVKAQSVDLTVAPARQTIVTDPGETVYINIKFLTQADEPTSGTFGVADFVVLDDVGTPQFLDNENAFSSKYSAANWVTLPFTKGTIPANDKITLQIKIDIPQNAQAGGRYFGVFFEPTLSIPSDSGDDYFLGTGVASRLAGLVSIRVSGPITEDATVTQFNTPSFVEYGPVSVTTEIMNNGNYHITPKGQVEMYDMLGRVVEVQELETANVFPEASRGYTNELGSKYMFGKYTLKLGASYGETGKALAATTTFWAFPWRLILVIALTIIIIILVIIVLWKSLKGRQTKLETKLEEEIKELEDLKNRYSDNVPTDLRKDKK
jgi:hypothetical protein